MRAECPDTRGVCQQANVTPSSEVEDTVSASEAARCVDEEDDLCRELGQEYCSENYYALRCRRTCELCPPVGTPKIGACLNKLSHYTCSRYFHYGWCERPDTRDAVRLQCAQTCDACAELTADREVLPLPM